MHAAGGTRGSRLSEAGVQSTRLHYTKVWISSSTVYAFTKCCKETGFLMVVKCRKENTALKDCLVGYYSDPSFYEECKTEYLKQREEYRATGIKKKKQKITSNI
ncbi:COX assembly mitochondrial protein homolog isoform X2 [Cygnus olor]|uniref:COX assembly mitochondrial protein homolog isoform X2 n=1 Tax=Cygnus olor TaxID=8869 RepID=UPI001ADEA272|nr:COX assembly mitochondrial protein homolog isoform X2 [Cygnus olor]